MKCTNCNKESDSLITIVNPETNETMLLCTECRLASKPKLKSIEEYDKLIKDYENLSEQLEELIKSMPKEPELPDDLASIAFTPTKTYKMIQQSLAHARTERIKKLTEENSEISLKYELKKAIEKEDYEKATEIQNKLDNISN